MKDRPNATAAAFVNVMKHPIGWLSRIVVDADINGREHLPESAPYIVTANHLSLVDPVFVTLAVGQLVQFLALDELFEQSKVLDGMMYYFGAIPISRVHPPLGAIKRALEVLEAGEVLGVFPEGGRAEYWRERPIKRGAAWLALATNSPIVPCAITGTEATMSLRNPEVKVPSIRLSLHPPLHPATYTDREDPLGAMMDDWTAILDAEIDHWQPALRPSEGPSNSPAENPAEGHAE
ncbi:MAG: lysophospholipid acyltransferase family protein [Acidimicrobiia bacterium]|nr:lysophospholipid acyltransferase family protein [Acidimicrobiia bacterium]